MPFGLAPSDHDTLREHYKKNVVPVQYILVDRNIYEHIWKMGEEDPAVNEAMCHLASIHRTKTVHSIQGRSDGGQSAQLDHIHRIISHRQINGRFDPSDAMASLHTISSFLFSGGRGSWQRFLHIACGYVESTLLRAQDPHFLYHYSPAERFIIRTTMWFEVLASVTLRTAPRFLMYYRSAFSHTTAYIEDDSGSSMLSVMGCENQVLLAIAETSALAEWKHHQLTTGSLSIPELVKRGQVILDILDRLDTQQIGYAQAGGADHELRQIRLQTASIFRAAARLYVHNIVNGDQPSSPEIQLAVRETVRALQCVDADETRSRAVVRSVVFPICIEIGRAHV